MKRTLLGILMLLGLTASAENKAENWGQFERYKSQNEYIMSLPEDQRPVVAFMGNSITENWVSLDPAFFKDNNFAGRGISGQTSHQMLSRFREDIINLSPRIVVINAGTNDVAENTGPYDENITFGNIVSMAELAKANTIKVILTSVLPAGKFGWRPSITDSTAKINSLNERIRIYAEKEGIPYVDYYSPMADSNQGLDKSLSNDGVHPTIDGYKIMEKIILPVIKENLK